jgi:VWFA-related protein
VAIITTSGRLGALQRLTADKRMLRAAVHKFRSLPNHRPGVGEADFTCAWYNHKSEGGVSTNVQDEDTWLTGAYCPGCPQEVDPKRELENDHRSRYYGLLSLSALRRVVDGLRELPGRRSILLFSEGLPLVRGQGMGETNSQVTDAYESFINHANRSGITVNAIDPRGLPASFATAELSDGCQKARQTELSLTQQQLVDIARRTGGTSTINDNDIAASMTRVMNDQLEYYLIGYKPPDSGTHNRGASKPRQLTIRVKRPGLTVRFHSSLYRLEPQQSSAQDPVKRLVTAVASPFAIPNVRMRLASRFWDAGASAGIILDTILEIDTRDLSFRTESDGHRKAVFDIVAVIYGSDPKPLDTFEKSYTVSLTEAAYQRAVRDGLVQLLQLRVRQGGAYQIRSAVRDRESERVGSTSEFVEVPDLSRGKLAVSGIALSGKSTEPASTENVNRLRFHAGETVFYAYQVLNAERAPAGATELEVQATLYHDGRALGSSPPMPLDGKNQDDARRLVVMNDFRLGKQLTPGDYTLKVTVTAKNAGQNRATASQTAEFQIVE